MKDLHYKKIISTFERLKKAHPTYNIGRHISTALDGDLWGVTDKEFLHALEKYEVELNMDKDHIDDEIDEIVRKGMHLDTLFLDDEEEE